MNTDLAEVREVPAENPLAILQAVVANPDIDTDKLEKLVALYERERDYRAKMAFIKAKAECKAELPPVVRDKKNTHTGATYPSLEEIASKCFDIIAKYGFDLSFREEESTKPNHIRVVATLSHIEGHSEETPLDCPIDDVGSKGNANKTPIQAVGSTVSYGRRYLVTMIFNIAVAGQDNDGNASQERIEPGQVKRLEQLLSEPWQDRAKFLSWVGVESVEEIPKARFNECVSALLKRAPKEAQEA